MNWESMSMGRGKMMVEFFSAEIELRVWRHKNNAYICANFKMEPCNQFLNTISCA